MRRPWQVRLAVALMAADVAVELVSFLMKVGPVAHRLLERGPQLSPVRLWFVLLASPKNALCLGLILLAVAIWMRQGWARWVYALFLVGVLPLILIAGVPGGVWAVIGYYAVILSLLFSPATSAFLREKSPKKKADPTPART